MSRTATKVSWAEANQALLSAEFARLKRHLGGSEDLATPSPAEALELFDGTEPAIDQLSEIFDLTPFERDLLLLCAGVEMDSDLAAHSHGTPAPICFGLAMGTLADPHWSAMTPARPLRYFQLLRMESNRSLTAAPLRIDERILHYIAGTNLLDSRLESLVHAPGQPSLAAAGHRRIANRAVLALSGDQPPVIQLCGNDAPGQDDVACLAAGQLDMRLIALSADDLPTPGAELDQVQLLLEREMLLLPAALLLQCGGSNLSSQARRLAERLPAPLFVSSRESLRLNRPLLRMDVEKPEPAEQRTLWIEALGPVAQNLKPAIDEVADQFSLSAATIRSTCALVVDQGKIDRHTLWDVCRSVARPRLENLAIRMEPMARWENLVLPETQTQTLHRLVSQVRYRMQVNESWGFSGQRRRGLGLSALFAGESGTGKTLAAEVLAGELRLDLYRIDLSSVVSKFIGETEKNLRQVFDAAEEGGVLLLFDEADALFGKRAEVKDSHDRYANIEVGYLLQRMEAYQGLAVLTTNLRSSLDRAFQRRLRFIVNFPFPDVTQREAIWRRIFPADTPVESLDYSRLAQLNVAGGSIRNIALNAAFLAAEDNGPVRMSHLLEAARMEAEKIERPLSTAEIRGWER